VNTASTLAEAQRGVSATLLWHLRVLAGWLPGGAADLLRPLAAGFEIANVEAQLLSAPDTPAPQPYRLGSLDTAWRSLRHAGTAGEVRVALARSAWGDPGADTPWSVVTAMRMAAARRVAVVVRPARRWAEGRTALLAAREMYVHHRPLPGPAHRHAVETLGSRAVEAGSFRDFRQCLPSTARWVMDGVEGPNELWRAETRWWQVLEQDGTTMMRDLRYGPVLVVGAVAVMSVDAWRVRAALELAVRGGGPLEVFDAVV
jgi:hypothetical protein